MGADADHAADDITPAPRALSEHQLVTEEELIGILLQQKSDEVTPVDEK